MSLANYIIMSCHRLLLKNILLGLEHPLYGSRGLLRELIEALSCLDLGWRGSRSSNLRQTCVTVLETHQLLIILKKILTVKAYI